MVLFPAAGGPWIIICGTEVCNREISVQNVFHIKSLSMDKNIFGSWIFST